MTGAPSCQPVSARLVVGHLSTSGHVWEAGRISHPLNMKSLNHALKKKKKKSLLKTSRRLQELSTRGRGNLAQEKELRNAY